MVAKLLKKTFAVFVLTLSVAVTGCSVDLFGLFASSDFDKRWEARNTFHFLSAGDRNITVAPGGYSFIVLSDTHVNNGDAGDLEKIAAEITKHSVDFVVVMGDISQNGDEGDIKEFIRIAKSFGVPVFPAIGNHDLYFNNWPVWEKNIGSTVYRVDVGTDAMLVLDSANGFFGNGQLRWLEDQINRTPGRVFVFTHFNLFSHGAGRASIASTTDKRERAKIISLLKNGGKTPAMFSGHIHKRIITPLNGTDYISIEDFRDNSVYILVTVSPGGVSREFKKL